MFKLSPLVSVATAAFSAAFSAKWPGRPEHPDESFPLLSPWELSSARAEPNAHSEPAAKNIIPCTADLIEAIFPSWLVFFVNDVVFFRADIAILAAARSTPATRGACGLPPTNRLPRRSRGVEIPRLGWYPQQ
jgi:hypothetical protein